MDKKKSRLITIALACLLSVSFASCGSDKDDKKGTTVVTSTTDASKTAEKDDDSKSDDKDDTNKEDDKDTEVTTVTLPEKDDDGSKITVIAVTDEDNKAVTDDKGAEVTKVAIVDDKDEIVTDAKGSEVAPNIEITEATTTTKSDRIVTTTTTPAPADNNTEGSQTTKNPNAPTELDDGPVLTIPDDIEAAPGEEFTFKISVTGNAGYSSLIAWLDVNEKYFEYVSHEGGDPDSSNHKRSVERMNTSLVEYKKPGTTDLNTLVFMYFDPQAKNLTGDTTFVTVTLKVKDDVKPGEYELCFDAEADGNTMANRVINAEPFVLNPTYVNGTVTIK